MILELSKTEISQLIHGQLSNILGMSSEISNYLDITLERTHKCFEKTKNKYYRNPDGEVYFNPYHSGQYSIFLYYLANTIFRNGGDSTLASKIYYLNKILNSVDWYYEIELPEVFGVEHPLGAVLGRAKYSNGFFVYQGCTVGGNKGKYPIMGKNVILYANSTVIGESTIGTNVAISTGTIVKDENIPDFCLVFGQTPNLVIKKKEPEYMEAIFSKLWVNV
ncbi:transferase [Sporomusa malonica]|uniref:Serine O-acetyltransferase n=1 Tax=Sporomusa malonica TaxID=112901 RepID=A0A1W1YTE3_9FIRM|nr:transferase [Sporomusa malonica]SMC39372.1 serine O-acetyltransferase [Sporomusa malonica]